MGLNNGSNDISIELEQNFTMLFLLGMHAC